MGLPTPKFGPLIPQWAKDAYAALQALTNLRVQISYQAGDPGTLGIQMNGTDAMLRIPLPSGQNGTITYLKTVGGATGTITVKNGIITAIT